MSIEILDNEIVNQIAAGEVIENPAGAIKELIENSIDAESSNIQIILEDYGLKKIIVSDDGKGIEKDDLKKAPLRHATSKIKNFNDLYSIKTMGFRGEALASIFAISDAKIISRTSKDNNAYMIESSNPLKISETAGNIGTSVIIDNIFCNVPARKKYLKSMQSELKDVIDVVTRYCIAYNEISFVLKHNDKILIHKPAMKDMLKSISYMTDKNVGDNLIKISDKINGININAYIIKPQMLTFSYSKHQFFFVNRRFIKSKILKDAVYSGYGTNLMEARHPCFFFFIDIDTEIIDVNVHPTKIEIKFENELEIFNAIKKIVSDAFSNELLFKDVVKNDEKLSSFVTISEQIKNNSSDNHKKKYFQNNIQKELYDRIKTFDLESDDNISNTQNEEDNLDELKIKIYDKNDSYQIYNNNETKLSNFLDEYRVIGQLNKTYILVETLNELLVIDQHAAEEKFNYETLIKQFEGNGKAQHLLKPQMINLDISDMQIVNEHENMIKKLGFEFEVFGKNDLIIRKIPIDVRGKEMPLDIFYDIIASIRTDKKSDFIEKDVISKIASMSCKRSIKAGHEMTIFEMKTLIERLKTLNEPFNCPHGRPVILRYSLAFFEKEFKRIV